MKQIPEAHERRHANAFARLKLAINLEAQRTQTGLVIHPKQVVGFLQHSRTSPLSLCHAPLIAPHHRSAPGIRSRIPKRCEHVLPCLRHELPFDERHVRRKPEGVFVGKPIVMIGEGHPLSAAPR